MLRNDSLRNAPHCSDALAFKWKPLKMEGFLAGRQEALNGSPGRARVARVSRFRLQRCSHVPRLRGWGAARGATSRRDIRRNTEISTLARQAGRRTGKTRRSGRRKRTERSYGPSACGDETMTASTSRIFVRVASASTSARAAPTRGQQACPCPGPRRRRPSRCARASALHLSVVTACLSCVPFPPCALVPRRACPDLPPAREALFGKHGPGPEAGGTVCVTRDVREGAQRCENPLRRPSSCHLRRRGSSGLPGPRQRWRASEGARAGRRFSLGVLLLFATHHSPVLCADPPGLPPAPVGKPATPPAPARRRTSAATCGRRREVRALRDLHGSRGPRRGAG